MEKDGHADHLREDDHVSGMGLDYYILSFVCGLLHGSYVFQKNALFGF